MAVFPMINNNMEMINELSELGSLYDYDAYVAMCEERGVVVRPVGSYLQGVAILEFGLLKFGGEDWQKAYLQGFEAINDEPKGDSQCCGDKPKEKEEVKPLGVIDTVKSLGKSVKEHVKNKLSHVSNEEANRRFNLCAKCPKLKEGFKCSLCHCYMGIKATWDIKDTCKLNKW